MPLRFRSSTGRWEKSYRRALPFDGETVRFGKTADELVVFSRRDVPQFKGQSCSPKLHTIRFPHGDLRRGPVCGRLLHVLPTPSNVRLLLGFARGAASVRMVQKTSRKCLSRPAKAP